MAEPRAVHSDDETVADDSQIDDQRRLDDMVLRTHPSKLFPDGIESVQAAHLFMGVTVSHRLTFAASRETGEKSDVYAAAVRVFDDRFARFVEAGNFQLTNHRATRGLTLDMFYGAHSEFAFDGPVWESIGRQTTLDPKRYMISILRAFVETSLLAHAHVDRSTRLQLYAVGELKRRNKQATLVTLYESYGFTSDDAATKGAKGSSMSTTVGTFLDFTVHLVQWDVHMSMLDVRRDPPQIFAVTQRHAAHSHL